MPKIWGNKLQRGSLTNLFVTWGYLRHLRHIFALNLLDSYVLLKSQVEGAFIKIAGCVSFAQDDYEKTKQHVIHLHDFVVIVSKQNPWDAGVPSATLLSHHNAQASAFAKVLHLQSTASSWKEAWTSLALGKLLDWLWRKWRPQTLLYQTDPNFSFSLTCLMFAPSNIGKTRIVLQNS